MPLPGQLGRWLHTLRGDESSDKERLIILALAHIAQGAVIIILVTIVVADWFGVLKWPYFSAVLMLGAIQAVLLAYATRTGRTYWLRHYMAFLPFICVLCQIMCRTVNTVLMPLLVSAMFPLILSLDPRVKRAIPPLALAAYLFFSIALGLNLPVFPVYDKPESREILALWSLLAGGLEPCTVVAAVSVTHWHLTAKRTKVRDTLRQLREKQERLDAERRLSQRLLDNILPREVAGVCMDRLRREAETERDHDEHHDDHDDHDDRASPRGAARPAPMQYIVAKAHHSATVLFADIVGFTAMSSNCDAVSLVASLNNIFVIIDKECLARKIEKIKMIGDCYMACAIAASTLKKRQPAGDAVGQASAAGAQQGPESAAAIDAAERVLQLATLMHQIAPQHRIAGSGGLAFRAGIHTGPVVSGVIGLTKLCYDLWGDAVNTASRMESSGLPGRTQVSAAVYELLQHRHTFTRRGLVEIKGKGQLETFIHVAPTDAEGEIPAPFQDAHCSSV